jgi:hypothetical protein
MKAYSGSCQSNPAGQSSDPVSSWLNPRSIFEFLCKGGWIEAPFGEIQSSIADFKDLVSSPLAPDAPLPILKIVSLNPGNVKNKHTSSPTCRISSSEPFLSRSNRPG